METQIQLIFTDDKTSIILNVSDKIGKLRSGLFRRLNVGERNLFFFFF